MKKILFAVFLLMAPILFLQSKAQAAEISLTAENFPDGCSASMAGIQTTDAANIP